jgi:hypothetical protein
MTPEIPPGPYFPAPLRKRREIAYTPEIISGAFEKTPGVPNGIGNGFPAPLRKHREFPKAPENRGQGEFPAPLGQAPAQATVGGAG